MVVQVVKELAVLRPSLLEPGAVVVAELAQRSLDGDRLGLTHTNKRTERLPPSLVVEVTGFEPATSTLRT
jgi:hypothetical protein